MDQSELLYTIAESHLLHLNLLDSVLVLLVFGVILIKRSCKVFDMTTSSLRRYDNTLLMLEMGIPSAS